jgi:hypothetical protein
VANGVYLLEREISRDYFVYDGGVLWTGAKLVLQEGSGGALIFSAPALFAHELIEHVPSDLRAAHRTLANSLSDPSSQRHHWSRRRRKMLASSSVIAWMVAERM